MSRVTPISGFPELLPAERVVEQQVLDTVRRVFELHGFASVETRAVEPVEQLLRKGEIDKEVYVLRRWHAADEDAGLALHFDLTVPLARYVIQNAGALEFPFRRYQIQKVWRGERPQEGRYREFTQADIDVIGRDRLPFHHEVEVALVMAEVFQALPIPPVTIRVNHRRLVEGFLRGLGATDVAAGLRALDKLAKAGPVAVSDALRDDAGLSEDAAGRCLELAGISAADDSFVARVEALGVTHPDLTAGLTELAAVVAAAAARAPGVLSADLSIARGLDYYTGTVYETTMTGFESLGSICSGGRYDALATDGRTTYPGVGISLGVTRMLVPLLARGLLRATRPVPSAVVVAVTDEATRADSESVADLLRRRGIPAEIAPESAKFGKQIRYADRRGIPFVWFLGSDGEAGSVKDIRTGDQVPADPRTWSPPPEDLHPRVVRATDVDEESHP